MTLTNNKSNKQNKQRQLQNKIKKTIRIKLEIKIAGEMRRDEKEMWER